jgi:hypothetical protein
VRHVDHPEVEDIQLGHDAALEHDPGEPAHGLGRVDRRLADEVEGGQVSEASSGLRSSSRARPSACFSSSDQVRVLVLTLMTTSGAAALTAPAMRA